MTSTSTSPRADDQGVDAADPITVQYDAQLLAWQHRGGISAYFAHLVAEFRTSRSHGVLPIGVPQFTANALAIELGMGRAMPRFLPHRVRTARALNAPLQVVSSLRNRDVVHHTFYANERLGRHRGPARIVTVHDMIPELYPELFVDGNPHQHKLAHVASADVILCVSRTTRDDLLNLIPAVEDRVRVTPLGVSDRFLRSGTGVARRSSTGRPFVLFVGMRGHYKNVGVVFRAMARTSPDVDLVLVGGGTLTAAERAELEALGLLDRVRQSTPSDEELRTLYRSALAFVFPSRYEGFGLPALEAMASGCPTLLARTPAFEEVAGDAARYFDPEDDGALAELVDLLVSDRMERDRFTARGRARAAGFTWERTASATAAAYTEARDA